MTTPPKPAEVSDMMGHSIEKDRSEQAVLIPPSDKDITW
jgi:hypothetical protein